MSMQMQSPVDEPVPGGQDEDGRSRQDLHIHELLEQVLKEDASDLHLTVGAPPTIGYPVAIAATPTGEVFVAVDEQGSLGRTAGGGVRSHSGPPMTSPNTIMRQGK